MNKERREKFVAAAMAFHGHPVCWGFLDCSDLVARAELAAGLPDRRSSHTAQLYRAMNPDAVVLPEIGDLGFFGSAEHAIHIVIALAGGHVLSADGATSHIKDPVVAAKNPLAVVRVHLDVTWYRSAPFLGWRKHWELDLP